MTEASISPREGFRNLSRLLLIGVGGLWLATGLLAWRGVVPILPDGELIGAVVAAVSAAMLGTAWFWARPKIPSRSPVMSVDDHWRRRDVSTPATLFLFLLDASAVLGVVGTMLSGYWPTALVAVVPMLAMLRCTPESMEH